MNTIFSLLKFILYFSFLAIYNSANAQIISDNCYKLMLGLTKLDYNTALDANYIYGRESTPDEKTSLFKISTAPAPNTSFYTIKTYDGKFLTRESSTNKIKVKAAFDEVENQVFELQITSTSILIYSKNTSFGESAMQWKNNDIAYVKGKNGSNICRYIGVNCLTENPSTGGNTNGLNINSWPIATVGVDNIINPNKGGVIIGTGITTAPKGYKLYVEEGILTEKFVVTPKNSTNWADFVFEKDYKLMSLSEVRKYIELNKHLPNVLSAKEISKHGINLAENLVVQLQKIEELTLYIIKQNEEIGKLNKRLRRIENTQKKKQ
ncbi:hypothetical protein Emtol_0025 (plasmid) [Emticicia oligotrophica DSM 17448]|uniref:Tail fiber domain-containing protein n=1 Tax=Emticicia oligotrophica (strain DSM 17448 / CIP 109782 / MTCC 6937 / GPTSA100-15) TaxID=929562 RepID=A0ABN4AXI7_EMTOG|nr:hypothetical protein [Emticicia oligotrophica]AFK05757.1 hypothetical protein Emtol_0025 [Emticicia oligotrophica DSM 17448]